MLWGMTVVILGVAFTIVGGLWGHIDGEEGVVGTRRGGREEWRGEVRVRHRC